MAFYQSLFTKINHWHNAANEPLKIYGVETNQWGFFLTQLLNQEEASLKNKNHLIICPTIEAAESLFESLKKQSSMHRHFLFPGLETSPYSGIISSEQTLFERFRVLNEISHGQTRTITICTIEALCLKLPPKNFFIDYHLKVETSDIIAPLDLAKKLVELGYTPSTSVEEPGSFCQKGEIFDIFPISHKPIRLHYFDDMIEEIFAIDSATQKTNRQLSFETVPIGATPRIFAQGNFPTTLRENIPMPQAQFKSRFEARKNIFSRLSSHQLFEHYPAFSPLFFAENHTLLDYFDHEQTLIHQLETIQSSHNILDYFDTMRSEFEYEESNLESDLLLPSPENLYHQDFHENIKAFPLLQIDNLDMATDFGEDNLGNRIELTLQKTRNYLTSKVGPNLSKPDFLKAALQFLANEFKYEGQLVFSTTTENSKKEIEHLMEIFEFSPSLKERTHFIPGSIGQGFYYPSEKILLITEGDLFATKKSKAKKNYQPKDIDLFAEQLATLVPGDFVIHSDHGLGVYQGLESLDVGTTKTDYIVIHYTEGDKVYLPVYKMNLIQKHADAASGLKPASLRTNKFQTAKNKAKNSVKKLAFDLLKLLAERESSEAFAFTAPDHYYNEFELAFPFEETPDQTQAIQDVLHSMQKPRPMDHLVCGDVGFGKTEVAMRAAFKAVEDQKQVAVLVPTTILALQHYTSFVSRFKNFPVKIEFLSRFKSTKESKEIKERLAKGEVDIIIGTHKLLSDTIKYHDLGLVIVDEEQRFGVGHKEKLKLLKASVDFLTLTATPIPRTLQLAFLGLRELSLIQTAPPRRQSIKSYIIKQDDYTLKTAIEKELNRGGQVFIVHNKVQDMDQFSAYIRELVPEAKIVSAHGQLPEKELENRMKAFYQGEYQILIATTIIESGLDIPNANTMIIDRADNFGLAQLHQLRGRIGRSDKKAYAYFVIPKHRNLTPVAEQRLKALQTYADMGSGFNIASCDLEIRGAGDILGGSQSGHIESIGLELYMELLKEAIGELKGESKVLKRDIEINTPYPAYIPNHYIKDSSERLKIYKKLSNCQNSEKLEQMRDQLLDIYGLPPEELRNLFTILEARIHLQHCGLKSLQMAGRMITLNFEKSILEANNDLRNRVVEVFMGRPKVYQFTPDYKVIYTHKEEVDQSFLIKFSQDIAKQIVPA